ncbi:DUF7530 family protein [Haloarchaeobius amylolyticus]|uniref:DUF7530 family protein n=1 Tax=Haloarchaeobius amylolyticus TaxID=1198296 RepID=UPI00226D9E19|nr:hypothetical protein [Haloarchaeobius amylolyticus]
MAEEFGETWVYESIVGALPGVDISERTAVTIQILVFEASLLFIAWLYDLWEAVLPGTAAVVVAAIGSALMLRLGDSIRRLPTPPHYQRLLFGSSVEVVLGVLAFIALVTHLFVFDPARSANPILTDLFGQEPPVLAVYLMLLILWDVAYRIGTGWWAAVTAIWRAYVYDFPHGTAWAFARTDLLNLGFAVAQLVLVPFVWDRPVLAAVLVGHVCAVTAATSLSVGLSLRGRFA